MSWIPEDRAEPQPALEPTIEPTVAPAAGPELRGWRLGRAALVTGLRLALLGRPRIDALALSAASFWCAVAAQLALSFVLAWATAELPRRFEAQGLASEATGIVLTLLISQLIAGLLRDERLLWRAATLITVAGLLVGSLGLLVQTYGAPRWLEPDSHAAWLIWGGFLLWWLLILARLVQLLQPRRAPARAAGLALLCTALLALGSWLIPNPSLWTHDYMAEYEAEQARRPPPLIAEEVFAQQPQRLQQALAAIAPGRIGLPELYFVAFGPYGEQDVFRKEAEYSTGLFRRRFGAEGRTLTLVNNRASLDRHPLATVSNLGTALRTIGQRMNREEDILFLFLTSHGSRDGELAVELEDLSFTPLSAPTLARLLAESRIRWKVLVVSGCYSGSFIDALKGDDTLLITASRQDRVSFGCSDGAEFTEFGRAYFEQALNRNRSFTEAFQLARATVARREREQEEPPSEPQLVAGKAIEAQLARWRATLPEPPLTP